MPEPDAFAYSRRSDALADAYFPRHTCPDCDPDCECDCHGNPYCVSDLIAYAEGVRGLPKSVVVDDNPR
jgi:hypothetical protein